MRPFLFLVCRKMCGAASRCGRRARTDVPVPGGRSVIPLRLSASLPIPGRLVAGCLLEVPRGPAKARHWGLIAVNLLLNLQYRNQEQARSRYVTDEELEAAIEFARPWLGALMWLAYLTGLRRGDLLRLTRFYCKEDGVHWVEHKTHKRVVIVWSDELRAIVDKALSESPDTRLFPFTESAINNAWGRFQRAWAEAGHERFLLRDIRAKHATDFETRGGDATAQLGHSTRAMTARHYLRKPRQMVPIR